MYRFRPNEKTFYNKKLYRKMNSTGYPSYLDISVPMAPNHHFEPVGEVSKFKDETNVKRSEALEEVHTELEKVEAEIFEKDPLKGKVFWQEAFKLMEKQNVNDPKKVLDALKDDKKPQADSKDKKIELKKEA